MNSLRLSARSLVIIVVAKIIITVIIIITIEKNTKKNKPDLPIAQDAEQAQES